MAKIPEYFAREKAQTSRLPRARPQDTGLGFEAQAIAGFGQDIKEVSGYLGLINEIEGNSQFDTSRRKVRESYNEFLFGLEDNKDPATYEKSYKKFLKDAGKLAPKNQVGNQKYQEWLGLQTPAWDAKVEWARRDMIKFNAQGAYITNLMGLSNIEDRKSAEAEARTLTSGAVGDQLITPRQGASDYQRIMADWDARDRVELIEEVYEDSKAMPYEEAVTFINDMKGLSSAERNDLITRRGRDQDFAEAAAVDQLNTQQRSDRQRVLERFIKKDFVGIQEFIDLTMLDPTEKLRWIEKAEIRADAISEGKDDPLLITKPTTYFGLRRRIAQGEKVTESELAGYVGEGISISDYEKLLGMLPETEEKTPLTKPAVKRGIDLFERLRTTQMSLNRDDMTLEMAAGIEQDYYEVINDFENWVEANPDATDAEIEKEIKERTTPIEEEAVNSWFDRLFWQGAWWQGGLVKSAAEQAYEKLFGDEEAKFQKWYAKAAERLGLDPDPDAPEHFYDYRAAYKAGVKPPTEKGGHWPSEFKREGHPRMFLGGRNTKTGALVEPQTQAEFNAIVGSIANDEDAKKYYDKWKHKW